MFAARRAAPSIHHTGSPTVLLSVSPSEYGLLFIWHHGRSPVLSFGFYTRSAPGFFAYAPQIPQIDLLSSAAAHTPSLPCHIVFLPPVGLNGITVMSVKCTSSSMELGTSAVDRGK